MSNMLEWLIRQHCEREGLGWPLNESDSKVDSSPARARPDRSTGVGEK